MDRASVDERKLQRHLDKIKTNVFLGKNSAFLGSLMCSVEFIWDWLRFDTVQTNGVKLWWGPGDFLNICKNDSEREVTLLHELWHKGLLHALRRGDRNPLLWNIACDYRINNNLRAAGYTVPDTWVVNPELDRTRILAEEEIYDLLLSQTIPVPADYKPDLQEDAADVRPNILLDAVIRAVQQAEQAGESFRGGPGTPGHAMSTVKKILKTFLEPKIPWTTVLMQFHTDLLDEDYSWSRPNRRYSDIYLPSLQVMDEGKLDDIAYIFDVSGSITDNQIHRISSEIKYIQEVLNPKKLTVIQFDTIIQDVKVFHEGDPFEEIEVKGRGGTSLKPVRQWIEENKPTAVAIVSDLDCEPMRPLTHKVPVIWVAINRPRATVPFGQLVHVTVED